MNSTDSNGTLTACVPYDAPFMVAYTCMGFSGHIASSFTSAYQEMEYTHEVRGITSFTITEDGIPVSGVSTSILSVQDKTRINNTDLRPDTQGKVAYAITQNHQEFYIRVGDKDFGPFTREGLYELDLTREPEEPGNHDENSRPTTDFSWMVGTNQSVYFLKPNGEVWCSGNNGYGQLGRSVNTGGCNDWNIGKITGVPAIKQISGYGTSFFLLSEAGEVFSMGTNNKGELGRICPNGKALEPNLGRIEGLPEISAMVGNYFIHQNRYYNCGSNQFGQLNRQAASGTVSSINMDYMRLNELDVQKVSTFQGNSYYFLTTDGEVYNCGYNENGELGRITGSGSQNYANLGKMPTPERIKDIWGNFFIGESGRIYNCGRNTFNALGRAAAVGSPSRVNLGAMPNTVPLSIVKIVSSGNHSLFLDASGKVYSCGSNLNSRLGRSELPCEPDSIGDFGQISGLPIDIIDIAVTSGSSFFLRSNGDIWGCGVGNSGELGSLRPCNSSLWYGTSPYNLGKIPDFNLFE